MFGASAKWLYQFLGSLKQAVVLLSALAIACSAATFYESKYGTEEAKRMFYGTLWFTGLLSFLAINVLFAALHRYPWQKRHTGFLITHAGLITMLTGAMIGNHFGGEGIISLVEGQEGRDYFTQDYDVLQVEMPDGKTSHAVPVDFDRQPLPEGKTRRISVPRSDVVVDVHKYLPHTRRVLVVKDGGDTPNPALHFRLHSEMAGMNVDQWLLSRMLGHNTADFGPARVCFLDSRALEGKGLLHLAFDGRRFDVPFDGKVGKTVNLGQGVSLLFKDYFPDFRMGEKGPATSSQDPNNPAILLVLTRSKGKSVHLAFADNPDLTVANSSGNIHKEVVVRYEFARPSQRNEIIFTTAAEGGLRYSVFSKGAVRSSGAIEIGKDISPGWMDMQVQVDQFVARGVPIQELQPAEPGPGETEKFPTLVATVLKGAESKDLWLRWGEPQTVHLGGENLTLVYGHKLVPLGFGVRCEEFTAGKYEGTQTPATFTSKVVIVDKERDLTQRATIWMNHPFTYRGFRIAQAAYNEGKNGEPDQTFLQVLKDPGWPLKGIGSILIVTGIITMFYIKPFLTKNPRAFKPSRVPLSSSASSKPVAAVTTLCLLFACCASLRAEPTSLDFTGIQSMAIQEGGRKKPLDTFAREAIQTITGKTSYRQNEHAPRRKSMDLLLAIMFERKDWSAEPLIWASYGELKQKLGVVVEQNHVAFNQLASNNALGELVAKAQEKQRREANPTVTRIETEALQLASRMGLYRSIASGSAFTIVPHPSDPDGAWVTPLEANLYYPPEVSERLLEEFTAVGRAYLANDNPAFLKTSITLREDLKSLSPNVYPAHAALSRESFYNQFRPFRKAWIMYLLAFLFGLATLQFKGRGVYWTFVGLCFIGIALHIAGFVLRCWIAGRPPVTNMYESVVWVSFGAILFATILELIFKPRLYLLCASAAAVVCLILADNLPSVLNPSIQPLVPVLRSNYWLTVHVLTITLGYAAFLLALALGHVVMGAYLLKPSAKALHTSLTQYLYRALQIGVLFLAAGTILGGVWAQDSWGRFWGWDPKETWALIALLGYLVVLHGRFAGWMGNFALGAASILCFQGVLMAWYGVNFVLGKGLHSYGFGTGGLEYVATYITLEILFVVAAAARYKTVQVVQRKEVVEETPAGI